MRTDPRVGYLTSLAIAGLAALWLAALWVVSDDLFRLLGMAMHAVTFLAIVLLATGALVALLFRSYVRAKAELVSGTGRLARWQVDAATWQTFAGRAETMDRGEKLGLLLLIWGITAVICGALALAVPRDARIFGAIGIGIAILVGAAFLLGTRVYRRQLEHRTGEVIVGRRGLLVNDVLHVWDTWLSWLEGARVIEASVPMLEVEYAYWARYGPQSITVRLPIGPGDMATARTLAGSLNALASARSSRRQRRRRHRRGTRSGETA